MAKTAEGPVGGEGCWDPHRQSLLGSFSSPFLPVGEVSS